jgi:hypothetical protein
MFISHINEIIFRSFRVKKKHAQFQKIIMEVREWRKNKPGEEVLERHHHCPTWHTVAASSGVVSSPAHIQTQVCEQTHNPIPGPTPTNVSRRGSEAAGSHSKGYPPCLPTENSCILLTKLFCRVNETSFSPVKEALGSSRQWQETRRQPPEQKK